MVPAEGCDYHLIPTLRKLALDQVCLCLASADSAITGALVSNFRSAAASMEGGFGMPSAIGDAILDRAAKTSCLTDQSVLELLRWYTPMSLSLRRAPSTVTDSLLHRYPPEMCAELERVHLGWSLHLRDVDALLLKIRRTGAGHGQEDRECPLRELDVAGHESISDGILKALAGRCPSLRSLTVDGCSNLSGSFLDKLARGCPVLASLSMNACLGLTDLGISTFLIESQAVAAQQLKYLDASRCAIGSLTFQALFLRGGHLRVLKLDGCRGLGDASIRVIVTGCRELVELSLLDCTSLTCQGAWRCTHHPTIETLSIPLELVATPDLVPVEQGREAGGGEGGSPGRSPVRLGFGIPTMDEQEGASSAEMAPASSIPPVVREDAGPAPWSAVPRGGSARVGRAEQRDGTQRRARDDSDSDSTSPPPPQLPIPRIPATGALRYLRLQVTCGTRMMLPGNAAQDPGAPAVAGGGGGNLGDDGGDDDDDQDDGDDEGDGDDDDDDDGHDGGEGEQGEGGVNEAEADRAPKSLVFPLRRLAPLLPMGLEGLDVRSCNALSLPAICREKSGTAAADAEGSWAANIPRGSSEDCVYSGGAEATLEGAASWPTRNEREQAPAFERAGIDSGRGSRGAGGEHDEGDGGDDPRLPVELLATPGDLGALLHACPGLRHLTLCGNPDRRLATLPVGARLPRIRGRGIDALRTTETAGVYATAAAIAYCLSPSFGLSDHAGGDGKAVVGGQTSSAGPINCKPAPCLRTLNVIDCPELPPMAILEALGTAQDVPLRRVVIGFSKAPSTATGAATTPDPRSPTLARGSDGEADGRPEDGNETVVGPGIRVHGAVRISNEALETLSVAKEGRLTELRFSRCPRLKRVHLSSCPSLRSLQVQATPVLTEVRVEDCGLQGRPTADVTGALWPLKILHLGGNHSLGDEVLVSALAKCPRLRSLRMEGCRAVGGPSLLSFFLGHQHASPPTLASNCLRLVELSVSDTPKFTGAHLVALAGALPCLRRLSIANCRRFTEAELSVGEEVGDGSELESWSESQAGDDEEKVEMMIAGSGSESHNRGMVGLDDQESEADTPRLSYDTEAHESGYVPDGRNGYSSGVPREEGIGEANNDSHHDSSFFSLDDDTSRAFVSGSASGGGAELTPERVRTKGRGPNSGGGHRSQMRTVAFGSLERGGTAEGVDGGVDGGVDESVEVGGDWDDKGRKARRGHRKDTGKAGRGADSKGSDPEAVGRGSTGAARSGKRAAAVGVQESSRGANGDDSGEDEDDPCQGLEFTVDGKTRAKLERLAGSLPREPGKRRQGRPACIRFLQNTCPNSARDCTWAHIPLHSSKVAKFKPLIAQAHEPLRVSPPGRSPSSRRGGSSSAAASPSTFTATTHNVFRGMGHSRGSLESRNSQSGARSQDEDGVGTKEETLFPSLQVLEIHACPRLKRLHGLRCPSLAVLRVTSCRWLASLSLDAPVASELDLSGCVRLKPWGLSSRAGASLSGLQVAVLNHCRALHPKFLALLVDHTRHLRRLEIYGAGVVSGSHGSGSWSGGKKEWGGGKRDMSRVDYNRIHNKTVALLKGLEKGRPKLTVVRTKKDFSRGHESSP